MEPGAGWLGRSAVLRTRAGLVGLVSVLAATIPILAAAIRAIAGGWAAGGDDAVLLIRSRDVLTAHHPLLGTWTSASGSVGLDVNNPGPLFWDVLALPAKLGGDNPGFILGVAGLHLGAVLGAAWMAHRVAGLGGLTAVMAVAAGIAWTMGSEHLVEPWQPDALLLAFLCFLVAVWALAAGHVRALLVVVGVGSLLVQTHVSYIYFVPVLALVGLAGAALRLRDEDGDGGWPGVARRMARPVAWSSLLFVVLWSQPVWEQLFGKGDGAGNLRRLWAASSDGGPRFGLEGAVRMSAEVLALPSWWARPSYAAPLAGSVMAERPVSYAAALAALVAVLGLVAVAGLVSWRARDRVALAALATAAAALVLSVCTLASIPAGLWGIGAHQVRWLWCVSAFWMVAVLFAFARRLAEHRPALRLALPAGAALLAVVLGVLALPAYDVPDRPFVEPSRVHALLRQLDGLDVRGTVLVDMQSEAAFDPLAVSVLAKLQEEGVDFRVNRRDWLRHLGESRRWTGRGSARIFFAVGPAATRPVPGATREAYLAGLTPTERRELDALEEELGRVVGERGLVLSPRGRAKFADGVPAKISGPASLAMTSPRRAQKMVEDGRLTENLVFGLVTAPGVPTARFQRLGDLLRARALQTFAVFLERLPTPQDARGD